MKVAYFACISRISGDMLLGALADAGCDFSHKYEVQLRRLLVSDREISHEGVTRRGCPWSLLHQCYPGSGRLPTRIVELCPQEEVSLPQAGAIDARDIQRIVQEGLTGRLSGVRAVERCD